MAAEQRGPGGDRELGERLAGALRRGADDAPVDVLGLLDGTRARAVVLRRRRRALRSSTVALALTTLAVLPFAPDLLPGQERGVQHHAEVAPAPVEPSTAPADEPPPGPVPPPASAGTPSRPAAGTTAAPRPGTPAPRPTTSPAAPAPAVAPGAPQDRRDRDPQPRSAPAPTASATPGTTPAAPGAVPTSPGTAPAAPGAVPGGEGDAPPAPGGEDTPQDARLVPPPGTPGAAPAPVPDLPRTWAALPEGLVELTDLEHAGIPVVDGQECTADGRAGPEPVVGRSWTWAHPSGSPGRPGVGVHVTGWAPGTAGEAFAQVDGNSGPCRFPALGETLPVDVPADESWAATTTSPDGATAFVGAARTGDVVVGVSVRGLEWSEGRGRLEALLRAAVGELGGAAPGAR
ncbi:hypothetical protein NUM3379_16070 [Kineococcus sp. NUM-3379]